MKILVTYFSFTGNTEKVALAILGHLRKNGFDCEVFRIEPVLRLKYIFWLLLSFVPALSFPIKNAKSLDLEKYDVLILGTPKWTFNCPPVTYFIRFLKRVNLKPSLKLFLFLTYGGFSEDVYLRELKDKIESLGVAVCGFEKFKRREIEEGRAYERIYSFCQKIVSSLNPSESYVSKS